MNRKDVEETISGILYDHWDPIGSKDKPRDEYASYAPELAIMAETGESEQAIADRLSAISKEQMLINTAADTNLSVSRMILEACSG